MSTVSHEKMLSPWLLPTSGALLLLTLYNLRFWQEVWTTSLTPAGGDVAFVASLFLVLFFLFTAILNILVLPRLFKPLLIFFLLASSLVAYFTNSFGTYINRDMMRNVFQTDAGEVGDLLTFAMLGHLLLLGVAPSLLLAKTRVHYVTSLGGFARRTLFSLGLVLLAAAIIYSQFGHFAAYFRNHREVKHLLIPSNYIYAVGSYLNRTHGQQSKTMHAIGLDVRPRDNAPLAAKPLLMVLVVGETARAANFQLAGYARPTNPRLSQIPDLLYFHNVSSCGTDTATSLPCMFSSFDRKDYDADKAKFQENVLDVVQRSATRVIWLDNQSGCKGNCDRVEHKTLTKSGLAPFCNEQECHDEILPYTLQQRLQEPPQNTLVVLHQMGSHGPAYYKRYPKSFERFTPACHLQELNQCPREEVVNAYDNTILYTDHILAETIRVLQAQAPRYTSLLLYVSDHGESLGENNLYLHGMPYAIAPREQTHVPMVMWLSPDYLAAFGLDLPHLAGQTRREWSHHNLFSTVLGAFALTSSVYHPEKDMLRLQ